MQPLTLFLLLATFSQADTWTSLHGGPHCRNSSSKPLGESLAIAWHKHFNDFPSANGDYGLGGRTANTPLIRDGKIWMIEPTGKMNLARVGGVEPTEVGIYSLATGQKVGGYPVPIITSTVNRTNAGIADTDMTSGVFWAFGPGNSIIATTGGDWSSRNIFNADTGEKIDFPNVVGSRLGSGQNCAAAFAVSPNLPGLIVGGNYDHNIYSSAGMFRITGKGWLGFQPQYKHWNIGLMDDARKSFWSVGISSDTTRQGFGTWVTGGVFSDTDATGFDSFYDTPFRANRPLQGRYIPDWHVYNRYYANGQSAPAPHAITDDGLIALFCHRHAANSHTPDFSKGSALIVLDSKTKTGNRPWLPGVQPYAEIAEAFRIELLSVRGSLRSYPQMATSGKYMAVFFPPSEIAPSLLIFNLETKEMKTVSIPPNSFRTFVTDRILNENFPMQSAVQCKIAGDSAYIFEPFTNAGKLTLRAICVNLSTANATETSHTLDVPADITRVALRDVAMIDGTALAMIQWRRANKSTSQTLVALRGATAPPPPPGPTPEQEVLDFAKPRLSPQKYAEIEAILR